MNLDRTLFWIRLIAWAILDVVNGLGDEADTDVASVGGPPSGFKPERIQVWLGVLARAALSAVEGVGAPPPEEPGVTTAGFATGGSVAFKPERIQFWLQLIARFVLAVIEETGKSGERSDGPAPTGATASEEVDNRW